MMMSERVLGLISAVLLFIAVAHLPIGYYTFLRIAVTLSAGYLLFAEHRRAGLSIWVLLLGCICILFNPLLPIYLGNRFVWQPIDIGAGLVLLGCVARGKRSVESKQAEGIEYMVVTEVTRAVFKFITASVMAGITYFVLWAVFHYRSGTSTIFITLWVVWLHIVEVSRAFDTSMLGRRYSINRNQLSERELFRRSAWWLVAQAVIVVGVFHIVFPPDDITHSIVDIGAFGIIASALMALIIQRLI